VEKNIVKIAVREHDLAVIACSFGRDSMAVLHQVMNECKKQGKPFKVLWNDTGCEYAAQYRFNKRIIKKWGLEENLIVAKSKDWTFWRIVKEYGMPILPRDKSVATQKCCEKLKKEPSRLALEQFANIKYCYFTGLNAYESSLRRENAEKYGNYFYSKSWKHQKCHPILWWTKKQIDDYIKENNIPLCEIYSLNGIEGYTVRNGCWACPQAWNFGKGKWLKKYYPKLYKFLVTKTELGDYILNKKLGLEKGQSTYFDKNYLYEVRPCFFEQM
jgi:3'-phosphoadenosine 5'-phosphosulfate sulfotransferase (PAPS reductase)/FAD synthetase